MEFLKGYEIKSNRSSWECIWENKKPRITMSALQCKRSCGGLWYQILPFTIMKLLYFRGFDPMVE